MVRILLECILVTNITLHELAFDKCEQSLTKTVVESHIGRSDIISHHKQSGLFIGFLSFLFFIQFFSSSFFFVFLLSNRKTTMGFDRSGFVRQITQFVHRTRGVWGSRPKRFPEECSGILYFILSIVPSITFMFSNFHLLSVLFGFVCPFWVCLSFCHIFFLVLFLFLIIFDGFPFFISFPFFS